MSEDEYNVRMEKLRQDEEAHASFNGDPGKNVYAFVDERKYIDEEGVFPLVRYKFMDSAVEDRVRLQHHSTVRFL